MSNFRESESLCENAFASNGPYWHLYTQGQDTPLIFKTEDDFKFAMNVICQAALEFKDIVIITFEIMGNHLHLLLSGEEEDVMMLFRHIRKRLATGLRADFPQGLPRTFSASLKAVTSLNAMRNTIAYINRNGYVADQNHTPFSYPWGAGRFYFNHFPITEKLSEMKYVDLRRMFRGRKPELPDDFPVIEGYVAPTAYCRIDFGESLFRNAHHYFSLIYRNVEAFNEMAVELGDIEVNTDNELYSQMSQIIRKKYGAQSSRDISRAQRLELAGILHYQYRSSNSQICRVLNLSQFEVDSLFPLSAEKQRGGLIGLNP